MKNCISHPMKNSNPSNQALQKTRILKIIETPALHWWTSFPLFSFRLHPTTRTEAKQDTISESSQFGKSTTTQPLQRPKRIKTLHWCTLYTISESRLQIQVDQLQKQSTMSPKKNTRGPIQASSGTTRPDQSPIMSEMEKEEIFRGSIGSQDIIGKVNHSKRKKNNFQLSLFA